MYIKNGRIIINEDTLEFEIKRFEKSLQEFFKTDLRFCDQDITVFVEYNDDCWNEKTFHFWKELTIIVTNYDKIIELGGKLAGEKRFATAILQFVTDTYEPQLVFDNGMPCFYEVFNYGSSGIANSETWENNSDVTTVEDILLNEVFCKWEVRL